MFKSATIAAGALIASATAAHAQSIGVNYANGNRWCVPAPSTCATDIANMAGAGVKLIRLPLANYNGDGFGGSINAAILAAQYGIAVQLVIPLSTDAEFYVDGANLRVGNANVYAAYPLSALAPSKVYATLQPIISRIDAAGVEIKGIELGNEINNPSFNGDIPLIGTQGGVTLGLDDLQSGANAEDVAIAAGLAVYPRALAQTQAIRDQLQNNWQAPIISAGLATPGDTAGEHVSLGVTEDSPLAAATIAYMRSQSLDLYTDLYGIHAYPWGTRAQILSQFQTVNFPFCGNPTPCAVTEFGYSTGATQQVEVEYMLEDAATFGSELAMIEWYDWKSASYGIWQAGSITGTGIEFLNW